MKAMNVKGNVMKWYNDDDVDERLNAALGVL
jgi:hypothetical protein